MGEIKEIPVTIVEHYNLFINKSLFTINPTMKETSKRISLIFNQVFNILCISCKREVPSAEFASFVLSAFQRLMSCLDIFHPVNIVHVKNDRTKMPALLLCYSSVMPS